MAKKEKKKGSFIGGLFKFVFALVIIAVLAVGALAGFLYFKYDINPIALVTGTSAANREVDLASVATNMYAEADFTTATNKVNDTTTPIERLSDKEIAAYLDKTTVLEDLQEDCLLLSGGYKIIQIEFLNIPNSKVSHIVDLKILFKVDLSTLKETKMTSFPYNILKGTVPNELYMFVSCSINTSTGESGYAVSNAGLVVVNLNDSETDAIFKMLALAAGVPSREEIATTIANKVADGILGDDGVYGICKTNGAQEYTFEKKTNERNLVVYKVDTTVEKNIVYNNTMGAINTNPTKYKITINTLTLANISKSGYNFMGWYTDITDENTRTTSIELDVDTFVDYEFTAKWTIITYHITLNLNGGDLVGAEDDQFIMEYTVETPSFTLPKPTKTIESVLCEFNGWLGDGLSEITNNVVIALGSFEDKVFYAYYIGETRPVHLIVDDETVYEFDVNIGERLNADTMLDSASIGMGGYYVETWKTADNNDFDFDTIILEETTLYGTWSYIVDNVYFYPYLSEFNAGVNNGQITIGNREKLVAYIDYAIFFNIKSETRLDLTYVSNDMQQIADEIQLAYSQREAQTHFTVGYGYAINATYYGFRRYGLFYLTTNQVSPDGVLDPSKEHVYEQYDYVTKIGIDNAQKRAEDFDDFNIEKVTKTLNVSTSDQLVWAIENGYRPVVQSGSNAEEMYLAAKVILRNIITDDMNDVDKLRAIYEWLIMNIQYDNFAASASLATEVARTYDSWSPEGVFRNGKAVCEGYAKALLIMAGIENIPVVYVTGNGHAWNKTYVGGHWYGIDATHGNVENTTLQKEILTYNSFLFTDTFKTAAGYTTTDFSDIEATEVFNFYDYITLEYNSSTFDLQIDSADELTKLFRLADAYNANNELFYYTVEFALSSSNTTHFNAWYAQAKFVSGISTDSSYSTTTDAAGNTIYTIFVVND